MTPLTRVALVCLPGRLSIWLRFGRPLWEDAPEHRTRSVYFPPGAIFARVEGRADGRQQLAVLRAAGPGERVACLDGIAPGAQLLLHATTPARTAQVLNAIATIEAQHIAPEDVSEDYWCVLHQRLLAGIAPPVYTAAEHTAAVRRRNLLS
ncbi:DUF2840 domain-containing protein [Luteimonas kalidii]|uniref:DUF2840 domain-containing protein n=1 Tax=Luteimonas kalidii TaxID=3042025 RepID=A0ABT6JXC2_9GAMM|nr:DUF2840 domain-containing protein [Luteimonas kalidii]MDH5835340.1 DUF2840 domain-containing protein [Luteimonas kalidii]